MFGGKKDPQPKKKNAPELPGGTYQASELIRNLELLPYIKGSYMLIRDMSLSGNFDNMMKAVNAMARCGWRLHTANVDREGTGVAMYCVMERVARPKLKPDEDIEP